MISKFFMDRVTAEALMEKIALLYPDFTLSIRSDERIKDHRIIEECSVTAKYPDGEFATAFHSEELFENQVRCARILANPCTLPEDKKVLMIAPGIGIEVNE